MTQRLPESFLLTRPLRDVTKCGKQSAGSGRFLLTRPLRDVTMGEQGKFQHSDISTHTPLAGRDKVIPENTALGQVISTHTPLAGRDDCTVLTGLKCTQHFYSHAPCGT